MHNEFMPLIQIRDVPESVRDELARKAAAAGQSMQAYLLGELSKLAERPSMAEIVARAQARARATGSTVTMNDAVTALTEPGSPAADLLIQDDAVFQVPSIFDAEVLSALRGLVRGGKFDPAAAAELVVDLMVLPVDRWHMSPLLPRMWELRENLTPYDAAYVALAELTGAILVTGDERITAAPGTHCDIQIIK